MDIKNTEKIVKTILFYHPETRDSDDLLYLEIVRSAGANTITLETFFTQRSKMYLPPYETVRRSRQKVQAENPDLRGTTYAQRNRSKSQQEYKAYALKEN